MVEKKMITKAQEINGFFNEDLLKKNHNDNNFVNSNSKDKKEPDSSWSSLDLVKIFLNLIIYFPYN